MTEEPTGLPGKAQAVGTAFGWGTAGYLIGLFVGVLVPDTFVIDPSTSGSIRRDFRNHRVL